LYHWTHLELQRYFDIHEPLNEKSADVIWEKANALLKKPELSVKGILKKFKIYAIGTTDDPIDTLEDHRKIAEGTSPIGKIDTKVIPSFRPDKALNINVSGFADYITALSKASGITIKTSDDVLDALENRLDFFVSLGCKASDHALENTPFAPGSNSQIDKILQTALNSKPVSNEETQMYKTKILTGLANLYVKRGIIMQLHLSSIRNINPKIFSYLGPDTGIDAIHDLEQSKNLAALLGKIEENGALPKTILYSLNPKDYYPLGAIMGAFQGTDCIGKMQLGSAWWFCDHRDGMDEQMRILANLGCLPAFIGMLTDSRSFLSYPRHEYFRRIMCNLIGGWVENGEYPCDMLTLEKIVKDISFGNAKNYFD
jgi:glucuronate isomerase